jgi:hypothetical protein
MELNGFRKQFTDIGDAFALAQAIVDTVHEPVLVFDKEPGDLDHEPDRGGLGAEEGLHTRATLPTDRCRLNDAAVRINRDHRHDPAIGEEDMVERTVSVHENLPALAANVLQLRHESLEIAGWQGKQKPIAGPIR